LQPNFLTNCLGAGSTKAAEVGELAKADFSWAKTSFRVSQNDGRLQQIFGRPAQGGFSVNRLALAENGWFTR
jgi:hypothetical protein